VSEEFSAAERDALRAAKLAVFEDRIIFDAQPPIDDRTIAKVAKRWDGRIPDDLVALWRTTFGGALDYDLRAEFDGHEAAFSFTELFFPKSRAYHDLWGWIEHEERAAKEAARERGTKWAGRLPVLPFGGFSYLERAYALTSLTEAHGAVYAWMEGIPGWTFQLQTASVTRIAPNVRSLFRMLALEADPFTSEDCTGLTMREHIDTLADLGSGGRSAALKLEDLVRSAIIDWRSSLADGSIASKPSLRKLCLEHAVRRDDVEIMERLIALGCDVDVKLRGGANALDHAAAMRSKAVFAFLLARGTRAVEALRVGAGWMSPDIARQVIEHGAVVDERAVFAALDGGRPDTARFLLELTGPISSLSLALRARERALDANMEVKRLEGDPAFASTVAELRARSAALWEIATEVDPTLDR
jgi:hypothetical protein